MANEANIRLVIDAIRTGDGHPEIGFNMGSFEPEARLPDMSGRGCGTAMCIAGWANTLRTGSPEMSFLAERDLKAAAGFLGLDTGPWSDSDTLFYPSSFDAITADHAIAVLEHLIATGKVDWTVTPDATLEKLAGETFGEQVA